MQLLQVNTFKNSEPSIAWQAHPPWQNQLRTACEFLSTQILIRTRIGTEWGRLPALHMPAYLSRHLTSLVPILNVWSWRRATHSCTPAWKQSCRAFMVACYQYLQALSCNQELVEQCISPFMLTFVVWTFRLQQLRTHRTYACTCKGHVFWFALFSFRPYGLLLDVIHPSIRPSGLAMV